MATLEDLAAKYGWKDEVLDEIRESAVPENFRKELGELGAKAKRAEDLEKELDGYRRAPARAQLWKDLNIDFDSLKPLEKKALESWTWEGDTPDKEKAAEFLTQNGIAASAPQNQEGQQQPAAAQIVNQGIQAGGVAPSSEADFQRELDAVPDGDRQAIREVLAKHGRLAQEPA